MPDFEKNEFKFPDEEPKNSKKAEFDIEFEGDDDLKFEIEDDTPPEDRNRQPMPKEIVEKLENNELEDYSDDVRQKFKQLKKVWHDERREKEAVAREHQEALRASQRLLEENKRIKTMLSSGQEEYVSAVKNNTEMHLEMAKRAYREAYDEGDVDKQLEAQERITKATMAMDRVNNFRLPPLQEETDVVQSRQQAPKPDNRAMAWQERNRWFGQDEEMTAAALGLHEKLKRNGVVVGSDEYYSVLDKTMRKRFAENFGEPERTEPEQREQSRRSPNVVAPATRSTSSKKVRLTQSQAAFIKKLGITPEQYVREVLKLEN
jgi:hypothetical protein